MEPGGGIHDAFIRRLDIVARIQNGLKMEILFRIDMLYKTAELYIIAVLLKTVQQGCMMCEKNNFFYCTISQIGLYYLSWLFDF